MRRFIFVFSALLFSASQAVGQHIALSESDARRYVSDSAFAIQRKPLRAMAEVFGVNMAVWGFNHFLMDEDFAKIGFNSIKRNLSHLPVWDTDKFSTNLIAHPYHGGLYFNAARSNGMSFWESVPFSFGGSLMWEYFMENELPSVNDLLATTFGGAEIGEITFRLSDLFIDDRSSGAERVGRELLVACLSPVRAVNRLITGESWRKSSNKGRVVDYVPVHFNFRVGPRFLAEQERSRHGELSATIGFNLIYGEPFAESRNDYYRPYEWFVFDGTFDLFSNQPAVTQMNAIGVLWGKNIWNTKGRALTAGVFQHFDFYDSQIKNKNKEIVSPYRISEAVAFGGGLIYVRKDDGAHPLQIRLSSFLNGIALGGSLTDHYFYDEKDYNLGSGYSVKLYTGATYKKKINFDISAENYHIFTWKGDNPDGTGKAHHSTQGDVGHSRLIVFSSQLAYLSGKKWNISIINRYFTRYTNYKYYEDTTYTTNDVMMTIGYTL